MNKIGDFILLRLQILAINDTYTPPYYSVRIGETHIWVNDIYEPQEPKKEVENNDEMWLVLYDKDAENRPELIGLYDSEEKGNVWKEEWLNGWSEAQRPPTDHVTVTPWKMNTGDM